MSTELEKIASYHKTQAILKKHGFTFKKSFGQNFLTDGNILHKIIEAAQLTKDDNVLEIGPGIGSLTQYLSEAAREVLAVEIDRKLLPILEDTLRSYKNVQVIQGDILKSNLQALIENFADKSLPIKVVANLPYYITTPILMHLIESEIPFDSLVVMMQKEVADRISAKPNSKAYGSLSIAVQYYMEAEVAFQVPRTVFIPAPNVDSGILRMTRRREPLVAVADEPFFFKVIKIAFAHRRKTLLNNLQMAFGREQREKILVAIAQSNLTENRRAESLAIEDFARLSATLAQQIK